MGPASVMRAKLARQKQQETTDSTSFDGHINVYNDDISDPGIFQAHQDNIGNISQPEVTGTHESFENYQTPEEPNKEFDDTCIIIKTEPGLFQSQQDIIGNTSQTELTPESFENVETNFDPGPSDSFQMYRYDGNQFGLTTQPCQEVSSQNLSVAGILQDQENSIGNTNLPDLTHTDINTTQTEPTHKDVNMSIHQTNSPASGGFSKVKMVPKKLHACTYCSYVSEMKYRVLRHMIKHTNAYFKCTLCASKFNEKGKLRTHTREKHGIELDEGRPISMLVSGDRPISMPVSGDRPISMRVSGDRPISMPVSGDRPISMLVSGDRPISMPVSGDRPISMPVSGDQPISTPVPGNQPINVSVSENRAIRILVPVSVDQPISLPVSAWGPSGSNDYSSEVQQ